MDNNYLIIAILIGLIPAFIAHAKGERGFLRFLMWWFVGAMLFIVALPWAIFMKNKNESAPSVPTANGRVQYVEKREERGIGGKLLIIACTLFNGFMALWTGGAIYFVAVKVQEFPEGDWQNATMAVGVVGVTMILFIWALGDAIFAAPLLLTRGKKIIEVVEPIHDGTSFQ
jgi:MFS family permease